jgi:ABC-type sugar transport system permease subunit
LKTAMTKRKLKEWKNGYLFILPSIIGFSVFVAYPLLSSMYYALTEWGGYDKPRFVGFANFKYLFTVDPAFWPSIRATFIFVLLSVPSSLILGLFLAMLLNKSLPGIKWLRTIYYLPTVVPSIASLTLWLFIYQPQYGLANSLLRMLGLPDGTWLTSEKTALPSLVLIGLWQVGSGMIIFLSGLQSVPQEMYEAAEVDGAVKWRVVLNITLPLITPILFLQLILGMIGAFQAFNQVQVLTGGGPNFSTSLLNFKIYTDAFNGRLLGYSIAEVWVLFCIIMIFTVLTYRYSNRFVYYESDNSR